MSTPAEDLANAQAAILASARKDQPVLFGWEIHVLTSIVWTPQVLAMFEDRLRPEVLSLARRIVMVVKGEEYANETGDLLIAARDFVAAVDKAWPEMAKRRTP